VSQTIFLVHPDPKADVTFTSTDPQDPALLIASPDLLGYVAKLYARSIMDEPGAIDNITVEGLNFDGNRDARRCYGADESMDGVDDNWGSWLPDECVVSGDAWCSPGTLAMQVFFGEDSSTGLVVRDVTISNTECGSALAYNSIYGTVDSVVIDTAGDHVHAPGCSLTDADEPSGAWSDGITFAAFESTITNNTIINASDIGMVCFACANTIISNNTVLAESGNYGMFAGIALHPYWNGNMAGMVISGNQVTNLADTTCGGIHAGINIGAQMWNAGCEHHSIPMTIGNIGDCSVPPSPPGGVYCDPGQPCQIWGYIPEGESFSLTDNHVTGAQVNYLIEGVEFAGEFILSGNVSETPRMTDWESDSGCTRFGVTDSWGTIEFAAYNPSLPG
jgi:parallel beta-helix repeat protein